MLAQRPESTSASDTDEDLFAGMTFPDVPSNDIVISHHETSQETEDTKVMTTPAAPKNLETQEQSSSRLDSDAIVDVETDSPLRPSDPYVQPNWSSLYPTVTLGEDAGVHAARNSYPALPSTVPRFAVQQTQEDPLSPSARRVEIPDVAMAVSAGATSVEQVDCGYSDNEHMPLLQGAPSAPPDPYLETQTQTQPQMQMQRPQQNSAESVMVTGAGTAGAAVSAAQGATTDKYVCCGQCRQWLRVPREVQMVHCPQCNVVNNCGLAELSRGGSAVARRDPNSTRGGLATWLSFCFENIATDFSDLSSSFMGTRADIERQRMQVSGPPGHPPPGPEGGGDYPPRGPPGPGPGRGPGRGFYGRGILGGRGRPPPPPPGHNMVFQQQHPPQNR